MPETLANPSKNQGALRTSLTVAGLYSLALLLIFYQTTWSMVSIWLRSGTFAHGFLILPISLWLVWNQRQQLRSIVPRPAPWIVILLIPPGFAWLLASLVDVLVVQQLALVAMLIVGIWAILGRQLAHKLWFPLFFLFFAVPMGEALIPPMMEFTATSTVWLIQQTGIPVYREGMYFTLPSGNWSVVEACSGVRYLIASVTLGVLYAYLTYQSFWRRFLFIIVSLIVPVLANTARAYIIVMLGHVSDMTIATGVDHLVYGWVFFGLVIFLLFWLGSFFREEPTPELEETSMDSLNPLARYLTPVARKVYASALAALIVAGVWPLLAYTAQSGASLPAAGGLSLPEASGDWHSIEQPNWQWHPYNAASGQLAAYYDLDGRTLGLFLQYPDGSSANEEIVGSSARFVNQDSGWRVLSRGKAQMLLNSDKAVIADQAQLVGLGGQLRALSWYRVGDVQSSNDYLAKFAEAFGALGFTSSGSYRFILAVSLEGQDDNAGALLQDFMNQHGEQLDEMLKQAMDAGR